MAMTVRRAITTILTIHTPNVFANGEAIDPALKNKNGDFFVD